MKRTILPILAGLMLTVFATPLLAQGNLSGMWFDPLNPGEGLTVYYDEGEVAFIFYTTTSRCLYKSYAPEVADTFGPSYNPCRKVQSFYLTGRMPLVEDGAVGVLYGVNGRDIDNDVDAPLVDVIDVGLVILEKAESGWKMFVLKTGDALDDDARIYHRQFNFDTLLIAPSD